MRHAALCSGYGGLSLAVEQLLGCETVWHSEIEPAAIQIHERHWDAPNIGDLTTVDWTTVEPVDVLSAGYPCQPFSHAGKRRGVDDDRHVWPFIADAVRVLRPRLCLFENVAGHLRLGFDVVLADLAGLRFDVEWTLLRAADVGAPHGRQRLFIVATNTALLNGARPVGAGARGRRPETSARDNGGALAHPAGDQGREPHGDGATTPDANSTVGEARSTSTVGGPPARRLQPVGGSSADWGGYGPAIARWEATIGRPAPSPTDARGRLNPAFVEWMMGLPAGWVTDTPISRNAQLKALGNGVVPQQAYAAYSHLLSRFGEAVAA